MTAKALDVGIAAHVASGFPQLVWGFEITNNQGDSIRFCTASTPKTVDGDLYAAFPGLDVSSIASTLGVGVDNGKLVIGDTELITREDAYDGVWYGARYRIFQFASHDPSLGVIPWSSGFIGNVSPRVGAFEIEHRDFRQALHQDSTRIHQFACPYKLGDAKCRVDLAPWTFTGVEVTGVTSQIEIQLDGAIASPAGTFTNGYLLFTTGANANGISRQIRVHNSGGVLILVRPAPRLIVEGDLCTLVAGCQHRPNEDCRDKFDNKVNYGGCDTKPPVSELLTGELA